MDRLKKLVASACCAALVFAGCLGQDASAECRGRSCRRPLRNAIAAFRSRRAGRRGDSSSGSTSGTACHFGADVDMAGEIFAPVPPPPAPLPDTPQPRL